MRKLYLIMILASLALPAFSQSLAQVTIDNHGSSDIITFLADRTILINMTKDGHIIDWGTEDNSVGTSIYSPRLEKYMGKEEYYPATANESYRGKVKYIGSALFTYYTVEEDEALKGKVKTIGSNVVDYYMSYDDPAFKGNIKSAGPISFTYYRSFENDAYKGKIKTVGATALAYYGSFDDKAYKGKIKNIDRSSFTYYSSYDAQGYGGALKTGSPIVYSGNVKYLVRN